MCNSKNNHNMDFEEVSHYGGYKIISNDRDNIDELIGQSVSLEKSLQ